MFLDWSYCSPSKLTNRELFSLAHDLLHCISAAVRAELFAVQMQKQCVFLTGVVEMMGCKKNSCIFADCIRYADFQASLSLIFLSQGHCWQTHAQPDFYLCSKGKLRCFPGKSRMLMQN